MIAVVTDSASMLPPAWREGRRVHVAPMTVVVDGVPYREGTEIDSRDFYRRLASGAAVSTSAPSPGDLLAAYQSAGDAGATHIVSIHTGSAYSAVLNAARIAAQLVTLPVKFVDSGTVSFPVALCVAAACDARDRGCAAATIATAARATASEVDSVFIVGVPSLANQGGRLAASSPVSTPTTILTLGPSGLADHGAAADLDDAITRMVDRVCVAARTGPLRVGVGDADRPDLGDRLATAIEDLEGVEELTRYEVGPSVGAHSGPGTVGAVWAPLTA